MNKHVRVVILNYNQPVITAKCVSKVLEQVYDTMEVVVVDNASSQENYSELEKLLPGNVVLIRNVTNSGYSAGNNVGIRFDGKLFKADFFIILNNDVFMHDRHVIEKLVEVLQKDINVVAASPKVCDYQLTVQGKDTEIQVRRNADYLTCLVSGSWWLKRLPLFNEIADLHTYADVRPYASNMEYDCDTINGACFIIRNDFLDTIGLFDEGTFLYFEEIILGHQIKTRNKKCRLITTVAVEHFQGSSSQQEHGSYSLQMYKSYVKSQLHYCKHYLNVGILGRVLLVIVRFIDFTSKTLITKLSKPFIDNHG
ncbi:MAG: glycosyltransferase family 2 protein [Desulfuromonadales bacterium]|nr:glycosyltransferase family 2 protein [Desulfuromonadales bacterium]